IRLKNGLLKLTFTNAVSPFRAMDTISTVSDYYCPFPVFLSSFIFGSLNCSFRTRADFREHTPMKITSYYSVSEGAEYGLPAPVNSSLLMKSLFKTAITSKSQVQVRLESSILARMRVSLRCFSQASRTLKRLFPLNHLSPRSIKHLPTFN